MTEAHPNTMIGRRNLPTGCFECGKSTIACAASRSMNQTPCCDLCRHPEP